MNKYDKEDCAGGLELLFAILFSFIVGALSIIGFIVVVTWFFNIIS